MNTLHYGDNLHHLRAMSSSHVDFIYLDPPFNSKAAYNLLFRTPGGDKVQAQTTAFNDTWRWDITAAEAFDDVLVSGSPAAAILRALHGFLGESDMMAYLAMMAVRLIEMHRVLKPTGSLYLHCDPTACHYLKLLLDGVFGFNNFRSEITWQRTASHGDSKTWSRVADNILFYSKTDRFTWNPPYVEHSAEYVRSHYGSVSADGRPYQLTSMLSPSPRPKMMYEWKGFPSPPMGWRFQRERMTELDAAGLIWYPTNDDGSLDTSKRPRFKRYLDEQKGTLVSTIWTDIPPVNARAKERMGYPTQKPVALLERILYASTNKGDLVLDPFCGCGTTIEAAERMGRPWIGFDVTHHAIDVIEGRLKERCPTANYTVKGRPEDLGAAQDLARRDKYEFQWWSNWLLGVQNYREHKKGSDKGIDGLIYFRNGPWGVGQLIVSVKGGDNVGVQMVRDLRGTIEREGAEMGVLVTLAEPTRPMLAEAASAGFVARTVHGKLPRLQIATIANLLDGRRPIMPPPIESDAFQQSLRPTRAKMAEPEMQLSLPLVFAGGKKGKGVEVEDHLSGVVLARLARG